MAYVLLSGVALFLFPSTRKVSTLMFHLLGWGNAALDASAGNVTLTPASDQIFVPTSTVFRISTPHQILWTYGGGIGLTTVRANIGSLRQRGFPHFLPLEPQVLPGDDANINDMSDRPISLRAEEDLKLEATNGAANNIAVIVAIATPDHNRNVNARDLRMIRFTCTPTNIVLGWSAPIAMNLEDSLEAGTYAVYGSHINGAATVAVRFKFQGQDYRPGNLAVQAAGSRLNPLFYGQLGEYGRFTTYSAPMLEAFGSAAGADAITGWLLVSKVA